MGGAVMGVAGNTKQGSLEIVGQRGDQALALPPQVALILFADRAREQGSPHDAAIHALGVGGFEDRAMFGIGFDRDQRAVLRGEGAHRADRGDGP